MWIFQLNNWKWINYNGIFDETGQRRDDRVENEVNFITTNFPRDIQYDEEMSSFVDRGIRREKSA